MNAEHLRKIIALDENQSMEFKVRYDFSGENRPGLQDEIAKDIIALFNTVGRHSDDCAYLILGIGERKTDGTRDIENVKQRNYSQRTFFDIANARCYPALPGLEYEEVELDGNVFGVITIPPSKHIHALGKDLTTDKRKLWRRGSVLIRHGDEVAVASPEEIELMKVEKQWLRQPLNVHRFTHPEKKRLKAEVPDLLRKEIVYADQECARTSDKTIKAIFVVRKFEKWMQALTVAQEPQAQRATGGSKVWKDIIESLQVTNVAVVLGDPGSGKTVLLLKEVQKRCENALLHLETEEIPNEIEFGVYLHASALAGKMAFTDRRPIEVVLDLLSDRHHIVSEELREWLLQKLDRGQVLLAIDALDEVAQNNVASLREGIGALARETSPCPMLFSARRLGYVTSPVPFASQWELLPFTPDQLIAAISNWFRHDASRVQYLKRLISQTPPLEDLLLNPLFCMLACKVWEQSWENAGHTTFEPTFSNRCELYQGFLSRFRIRWVERMERLGKEPSQSENDAFLPFAEHLAWQLWNRDSRRSTFTQTELNEVIDDVRTPALANRENLLRDICEAGMMTRTSAEDSEASYLFLHRTILEFLAACYLARNVDSASNPHSANSFRSHIDNPNARGVLWMVSGRLKHPGPLLKQIVSWARQVLESSKSVSIDTQSPAIACLLVDCLFESRVGALDTETRKTVWDLICRGLDRLQRRRRKDQWRELADWSLVYRAFYAVKKHEGAVSRSELILKLLNDIRSSQMQKGGVLPQNILKDFIVRIRSGYGSSCSIVRWMSVWITARLFETGRATVATECNDHLVELLQNDGCQHVRSIICRSLARVQHPRAFAILKECLNGSDLTISSAAAIGLEHLMTDESIDALKAKARSVLTEELSDVRNPLPVALIGALEGFVSATHIGTQSSDHELIGIFMDALEYPMPLTRASAASALGKMAWKGAWPNLRRLVEEPDDGRDDIRILRGSAAFACSKLCKVIDVSEFINASEFLQERLRDENEIPQVRRPAADGLQVLARRGHFSESLRRDLLQGTRHSDTAIATCCILALMRFQEKRILEDISLVIQEFDRQNRKVFCEVVRDEPTKLGMILLLWLLENDSRPDVITTALSAVGQACMKALNWRKDGSPNYVDDPQLLTSLIECCLTLLQNEIRQIVSTSVASLGELCQLFEDRWVLDDPIKERVQLQARELLQCSDPRIQAGASRLLAFVGNQSDIATLIEWGNHAQSKKLRESAQWSINKLSKRIRQLKQ